MRAYAFTDETIRVLGLVGVHTDITTSKRSQELFKLVAQSTNDVFYEWNVQTDSLDWFSDIATELGYALGEVSPNINGWIKLIHPEDRPQLAGAVEKHRTATRDINYIYRVKHKNGTWRYWRDHATPVLDSQNRPVRWVGGISDITEHKRAEEEREILQAQLIQAQKMESIGTLAGGIAHNFSNILMGVQGRTSLIMMDKDPSDPDYEQLKGIETHVKNAVELTRDLLGFARGVKYEVKPTDLNTLIKHENRMFNRTKREIRVHGKYEKALWSVDVDKSQIQQALLNLFVNAWQAMPGGGNLYIKTENVSVGEEYIKSFAVGPGRYVKVSVTDTGVGMDAATREKIFDPFFTTKDIGQSSGLGLASVYGIIKNHGGFIDVYTEKGEGTTFNIYLPASERKAVKEGLASKRHEIQYGQGTILLVDDEKMVIEVGQAMLKKIGYRVLIAGSGQEALDLYGKQREEIDLVILERNCRNE